MPEERLTCKIQLLSLHPVGAQKYEKKKKMQAGIKSLPIRSKNL